MTEHGENSRYLDLMPGTKGDPIPPPEWFKEIEQEKKLRRDARNGAAQATIEANNILGIKPPASILKRYPEMKTPSRGSQSDLFEQETDHGHKAA